MLLILSDWRNTQARAEHCVEKCRPKNKILPVLWSPLEWILIKWFRINKIFSHSIRSNGNNVTITFFVLQQIQKSILEYTSGRNNYCTTVKKKLRGIIVHARKGARTLGTCTHVASVIWFLGFARYEDAVKYPTNTLFKHILDAAEKDEPCVQHSRPVRLRP